MMSQCSLDHGSSSHPLLRVDIGTSPLLLNFPAIEGEATTKIGPARIRTGVNGSSETQNPL